ncbi:MAG: macro domain-containing protein [Bacillota bacterium]|nr:macro domain-containing protein [Bacillota bacterium]
MPLQIIQGDLTKIRADAVVNAANTRLMMGGGVCGALFTAAGAEKMQKACDALAPIRPGEAVITPGFDLPAKYVIHTAGPIYEGGNKGEKETLEKSYASALKLAENKGLNSVAFPLISSGIYGYPYQEALHVAMSAIRNFLSGQHGDELQVSLVLFDRGRWEPDPRLRRQVEFLEEQQFRALSERARYPEPELDVYLERMEEPDAAPAPARGRPAASSFFPSLSLIDRLRKQNRGFSEKLFELIDEKGFTDVEVYKRANIDRKHFSKIKSNRNYTPGKMTVLAFAIALELNVEETENLLAQAGYALSPSSKTDIIISYYIEKEQYDIDQINQTLFYYDQGLLGAVSF